MKITTKICSKCGIEKPLSKFYKRKETRTGVASACKKCQKPHDKARGKLYYKNNKEKVALRGEIYRRNNKEKINIRGENYYKINKDRMLNQAKMRRKEINIRLKQKYKTDLKFKLNSNVSTAIWFSLKGNKNGKHWEDIVGYTLKQLIKHLEKQFTEGMSWGNYGKAGWWIDHIIPISVFNFTKPKHQDFKKCWALKNLQPLWAIENIKKQNKIDKHFQPSLLI